MKNNPLYLQFKESVKDIDKVTLDDVKAAASIADDAKATKLLTLLDRERQETADLTLCNTIANMVRTELTANGIVTSERRGGKLCIMVWPDGRLVVDDD